MTLSIISSNRVETLQARLAQQLAATPLADPLAAEIVVVPTFAMGRWLNLRIAQQRGIAANIRYPQLGDWVWSLANSLGGAGSDRDPYAGSSLSWRIFALLPRLLGQPAFGELAAYLGDDHDGIKRWQLSLRIAGCLDRYQSYRPRLIRRWSAGEERHWQARLWREIVAEVGRPHRCELIDRLVARLRDPATALPLPPRVSLFAASTLPPYLVELVHALAERTEVLLYQHSPTDHYWADLVNTRQQARRRLDNPRHAEYFDEGNSLLASWGRQGQVLQDLLLDLGTVTAAEVEDNHPPGRDSLLQRLQGSLFELAAAERRVEADDSLSVHVCHSPMRECQVLYDHLLDLLQNNPDLASEDILVMVPEISRYAPYIEAVFQQDDSSRRPNLPWNISDITVADGHPWVQAFLQLLQLPSSRFTRSEILGLLDCAEIRDAFAIRAEDLDEIQRLVETSRVRWGVSAGHRQQAGLPGTHENTWQQAWERFFAGYAMADTALWQGIAPIAEVDSAAFEAMARFRQLFERLLYWRGRLARGASAADWRQRLHRLLDDFFAARGSGEDRLLPLREAIGELGDSGTAELTPALVAYWMEKQLASSQQAGRLYSGGITFCGMQPLRNIPFPVICVLGMQDTAFPRREQAPEFDLMRRQWRPGDPSRGDEDRYLMLETLLCARRYLYFSYCGRSLRDNSECQPSVLLRELLDYLDTAFDSGGEPLSRQITRLHPMQAFAARNFTPGRPGFDGYWYATARQLATMRPAAEDTPWARQALAAESSAREQIELAMLQRFYSHPIRFFFQSRLGLFLPSENSGEDEEIFTLDSLARWTLATRIVEYRLAERDSSARLFSAQGMLPHGAAAEAEWQDLQRDFRPLLERLQDLPVSEAEARRVDCRLDDNLLLSGQVRHCYPDTGLVRFSASKSLKGRALLALWLDHLALCAAGLLADGESSRLVTARGDGPCYRAIDAVEARALLLDYVELFRRGLGFPLPVFPDSSFAWARESDPARAKQKALQAWRGGGYRSAPAPECEDEFIRLALHNHCRNPLEDELFAECAQRIYKPAIDRGEAL